MPVSSSQRSGPESRFQHLLLPIRDLTKNWNVDIASQLGEYLAEIEKISISFDGGVTTMNFAEAALLIQGSACVYSKKVEYLCSLVNEMLGSLTSRKKALAADTSMGGEGNAAADEDQDEEFLDLDDIQEMRNIDTRTDPGHSMIQNIPKTPLALVPLEETEKEGEPLLSRAGEVIASRSDFNMNLGQLHSTGVILLDMSHLSLLEHSMASKPASTPAVPRSADRLQMVADMEDEQPIDEGLPEHDISMEDINDGGCDMPEPAEPSEIHTEQRHFLRENARTRQPVASLVKQTVDAWVPLNPHVATSTATERPFRKGRTSKLPPSLKKDVEKTRKRKKDSEERSTPAPLINIADFCMQAFYSYRSKYPSNPLKAPSFPEFEQLFSLELRRRQTKAKLDRKMLLQGEQFHQMAEEDEAEEIEVNVDVFDDDIDAGDMAGDDFGEVHLPPPGEVDSDRLAIITEIETAGVETAVVSSFEEMVLNHVEGYLASAQQYVQSTELSRHVSEWADKIVPRLADEEKRNNFDIHDFGTTIIRRLSEYGPTESSQWIPFSKLVESRPRHEVCRTLLASLQLANTSNLDLSCDSDIEKTVDSLKVKLLSVRRHHEDLANYRAPSAHV